MCQRCRDWRNKWKQEYREKQRLKKRCSSSDCPNAPDPGYKSCFRCRQRSQEYQDSIRPILRERGLSYYQKVKKEVFLHYGGETPKCDCCGESSKEFLSIDHTNGDGPTHRKDLSGNPRNGVSLYYWLRKNNFPPGFRVLCMNCNFSLGHHGYCPHHPEVRQPFTSGRPRKEGLPKEHTTT